MPPHSEPRAPAPLSVARFQVGPSQSDHSIRDGGEEKRALIEEQSTE